MERDRIKATGDAECVSMGVGLQRIDKHGLLSYA